jgi:para-nitrobenzyl esterase
MPKSWPYFQQAIAESGPVAGWTARPRFVFQAASDALAQQNNCSLSGDYMACLRAVDAEQMMKGSVKPAERAATNVTVFAFLEWGPVIDGVEIVEHPIIMMNKGLIADKPFLLGTNLNEGTLFVSGLDHDANETEYETYALKNFGPVYGPRVLEKYPAANYPSPWWAATEVITDSFMACPARATARAVSKKNQLVFLYQFTHAIDEVKTFDKYLGVFHASELIFIYALRDGFVFLPDHIPIPIVLGPGETDLSKVFTDSWMNYGAGLQPNSIWPLYNSTSDMSIDMDLKQTVVTGLKKDVCDFWDTIDVLTNPAM